MCIAFILSEFSHLSSGKNVFFVLLSKEQLERTLEFRENIQIWGEKQLSRQSHFLKTAVSPLIHSSTHISFKTCFRTTLTVRILSLHC